MRSAITIAGREIRSTFGTPFGWGLAAGFLALAGVLLVLALRAGEARLDGWFGPLFVLAGVICPLLTMRSFAEEERSGSLELLLTAPVRRWQVVLGKLLGAGAVLGVLFAVTVTAPLLVASAGDPDAGPIYTGYIGLALAGVAFLAVGLAASSATSSQLVAAAISAGVLLGLWFGAGIADAFSGTARAVLRYLSPSTHVTGFLRGTLSLPDIVFFVSLAGVALWASVAILESRR
jgi:ABC-2 type transport system permease protein